VRDAETTSSQPSSTFRLQLTNHLPQPQNLKKRQKYFLAPTEFQRTTVVLAWFLVHAAGIAAEQFSGGGGG